MAISFTDNEAFYKHMPPRIYAIDLFCGVGGLTHGLQNADINVTLGVDVDPACEYPYTANNKAKFFRKSVMDLKAEELSSFYQLNALKLLAGCAPCQTFSSYNQKASDTDKRWWLLKEFSRLVKEIEPDLVTMENVPRLREMNVFKSFVEDLITQEYEVSYQVVNCAKYGIPQNRNRLVLLASKLGPIELLSSEAFGAVRKTVREAIGNLPCLAAGATCESDFLHRSPTLSATNLSRIRASRPGGTWRDWPSELVANCHARSTGKTYASVYGRMGWDNQAPTMTTQFYGYGSGRFGHPDQDRAISLREGAILQSFPVDYAFVPKDGNVNIKVIGRLIGNAVPVKLGELIGASMQAHVARYH